MTTDVVCLGPRCESYQVAREGFRENTDYAGEREKRTTKQEQTIKSLPKGTH